jgi:hypothetical protein
MAKKCRHSRAWRCKWCWLFFVCLVAAGVSFGQGNLKGSGPPIEILKLKWAKEVRLPRNFDPSIIPASSVFSDPTSKTSVTPTAPIGSGPISDATRAATNARIEAAGSSTAFPVSPGRLPVFYVYSMKVRNTGVKTIEGIAWDYLFIDAGGNKELGSHQFLSYHKVPPDKIVTFQRQLRSPPTRVVQASSSQKSQHPKLVEKAVIQCILFTDNTIWRSPQTREGACDLLKNGKAPTK